MGAINFYLKKPEPVSGKSLIFLQWKYRGKRLIFSTGESIDPGQWNKKKQQVKNTRQSTVNKKFNLNNMLVVLKNELEGCYNSEIGNGIIPTPETLRKHLKAYLNKNINAEKEDKLTLWKLIDMFISGEIRDRNENKKTAGTLKNYRTVKTHLQGFDKKYKYRLAFENLNREFLDKYLNYLEQDAKLANNTIAKNLQTVKVFMNIGFDRGYHQNNFYKSISRSWEESENIALSTREINLLYKHKFSNSTLERVRDLFVIGCHLGLRISDLKNIQSHNIIQVKGETRIRIKTQKTKIEVEIACPDQVLSILKKYKNVLPKISDQKFNQNIKIAAKEAGLTMTGKLQKNPEKPLYMAISSHTCRRSFCTNLYNQGVPPVVIMKISGHTSETSFLKYIKVSQTDAADKLSAHYRKLKESNLMAV
jgi:integrase